MKKILNVVLTVSLAIILFSCDKHEVRTINFLGIKVAEYQVLVDENKNEIKDGYYYEFHETGKVSQSGNYLKDKKVGEWKYFDNKSNLLKVCNYLEGKKNGVFVKYNNEGKTLIKGNYKEDKRDGVWEYAATNDTIVERHSYENGLPTELFGEWSTLKNYSKGIKSISFENSGHCVIIKNNGEVVEGEALMLDTNDNGTDDTIKLPIGTYNVSELSEDNLKIFLEDGQYIPFYGWDQTIIKAQKVK